ncbi:type I methionyl aminopeptidase [candidate division WWE3 bacterium RIFCSPLOWO2_01_FULL_39_13]|uniref:Methionine aminopeptidase n=1 Tax=candidate division WWE3 bacterium RIFCSPLOWO2_01_FULL_39_13 TaxID=1802624 RepID=A0A1F4V4Y2_UNCKA|nr:MAG: type I methionyl aminopeptidase [candidate division WWE3 bacterium RIFCSPLOWO2_01_FULL_39_13]
MILLKSASKINTMRDGGRISAGILDYALQLCEPGISTLEINNLVERKMHKSEVKPWFHEVNNYPYALCISVNEVWIHGQPSKKKLKSGDIVSIDAGIKYKGFYLDNCWTISVGGSEKDKDIKSSFDHKDPEVTAFLKTGPRALDRAISRFISGNYLKDISAAIQKTVEKGGYSVIREFGGHGIGKKSHEPPFIPCYMDPNLDIPLKTGMVFAVEVMYAMGSPDIEVLLNDWDVASKDKKLTAMFEHTVALTENGPEILTK